MLTVPARGFDSPRLHLHVAGALRCQLHSGLGGYGGSSVIDGVILLDKDANPDGIGTWSAARDGTLEERVYYCQTGAAMCRSSSKTIATWSSGSSTHPMTSRSVCRAVSGYGGPGLRAPTPFHRAFPLAVRIGLTGGRPRRQRSRGPSSDVGASERLNTVWGEASIDDRATPPSADVVHLPGAQALPRDRIFGPYTHQYSQGIKGLRRLFRSDSI